jgi:hypothetical protein
MKCIVHEEADAVGTCERCGCGICKECVIGTYYQVNNKPLCKKCNYEVGCENDQIFKSFLRSKQIKLVIFLVTFVAGIIIYITNKANGSETVPAVIGMLFVWGLGFIGNFFDKKDTRSVKAQTKDALLEVKYPVSTFFGKILSFFIMALFSPIQVLAALIGIYRVKRQIAKNNEIMNQFMAVNAVNNN